MNINKLLLMAALHFVIMYFLMYSMVFTFGHVYHNINQVYMAAIMTAPMLILEVILMGSMYKNQSALYMIAGFSVIVFIASYLFIRQQTFVGDKAFLRSMIPHHSGAILMCGQADITDTEIKQLCREIIQKQREEISQMETILGRLK